MITDQPAEQLLYMQVIPGQSLEFTQTFQLSTKQEVLWKRWMQLSVK
jgi:hypothetical protein